MEKANVFTGVLLSPNLPLNYLRPFYKIIQLFFILYTVNARNKATITDLQLYNGKIKKFWKLWARDIKGIALYIRETSLKSEVQNIHLVSPIHKLFFKKKPQQTNPKHVVLLFQLKVMIQNKMLAFKKQKAVQGKTDTTVCPIGSWKERGNLFKNSFFFTFGPFCCYYWGGFWTFLCALWWNVHGVLQKHTLPALCDWF